MDGVQPFLLGPGWVEVRDGDPSCRAIFDRHYSRYVYADGRRPKLIVGPGQKMLLLRCDGRALFAWRKYIDHTIPPQHGVECAIFRNEGEEVASLLVRSAVCIARRRWPEERFYTKVDPAKVKPTMVRGVPVFGFCFFKAGWKFAGVTKGGLILWERTVE